MKNRSEQQKSVWNANRPSSPIGWGIGTRLIWATGASALLWLLVAWALGRL